MRIINIDTKQEFDQIAAIRFYQDGCNVKGVIEVQGNQIPPDGMYSLPDHNDISIHVKNDPSSIHEWLEFDVVVPTTKPILP